MKNKSSCKRMNPSCSTMFSETVIPNPIDCDGILMNDLIMHFISLFMYSRLQCYDGRPSIISNVGPNRFRGHCRNGSAHGKRDFTNHLVNVLGAVSQPGFTIGFGIRQAFSAHGTKEFTGFQLFRQWDNVKVEETTAANGENCKSTESVYAVAEATPITSIEHM